MLQNWYSWIKITKYSVLKEITFSSLSFQITRKKINKNKNKTHKNNYITLK